MTETDTLPYTLNRLVDELHRLHGESSIPLIQGRRILVIGGAGYIGSVLVRRLLTRGYGVTVLDSLLYDNSSALVDLLENPAFTFIRGDFCQETAVLDSLSGITDVVLLAALVGDPLCRKYPEHARLINQEGPISLLDILNGRQIGKFVFISTCSNYGLRTTDDPATEDTQLNPQSLYAETKVSFERHLMENLPHLDFCPTILRAATAFGLSPRMRFDLTVAEFTRELALGRELLVYDENTWRPYCHVADISDAIIRVLESPEDKVRGEVYNVGSNEENYTKEMIVRLLLRLLKDGKVRYQEGGLDPRNYRVSFDRLNRVLQFKTGFSVKGFIPALMQALTNGFFNDVENRRQFYGNHSIDAE